MIKIKSLENQIRLDQYLIKIYPNYSRSHLQKMIKEGHILVDDKMVKTGFILTEGDIITLEFIEPQELDMTPVQMDLEVLYEDDDLMVIVKPKGLVVHPSTSYKDATLVHGLLYQAKNLSGINGVLRPGIVHRLDKDTSGLMLVAKHDKSHQALSDMLSKRLIHRYYKAICYGDFDHQEGIIDAPIARDPNHRLKMATVHGGRSAVTHFKVLKQKMGYALVEFKLETGRTHQIRVHMKFINHPILGDPLYGPKKVYGKDGQYLHAYKLAFAHPMTKKEMVFETPLPQSFDTFLNSI